MSTHLTLQRFTKVSFFLWLCAVVQSALAIVGVVSINQSSNERILFGIIELLTMALLILNAIAIKKFMAKQDCAIAKRFSSVCLYSLVFCFAGDVVNRNFMQQFYQYDEVIKHSYLADSVMFFFPGYLLLVLAIAHFALTHCLSKRLITVTAIIVAAIALNTYYDMHLMATDHLLTLITASYSVLVSILAVSALWLVKACTPYRIPIRFWCAALGLILAMVADAIIGKFWIFGNQGQGYFPLVSQVNWIVYFASQALIQQLPIGLLEMKVGSDTITSKANQHC